jgi:hypothetical protein
VDGESNEIEVAFVVIERVFKPEMIHAEWFEMALLQLYLPFSAVLRQPGCGSG